MGDLHSGLTEGEIHQVHDGEYDNLDALEAASFVAADIGKFYRVTDHDGRWMFQLVDTTPTFSLISAEVITTVTTTDATETALATFATSSDFVYFVESFVVASVSGGGDAAGYQRKGTFKNDSGTLSAVGSVTGVTNEDNASWDCQLELSGTNILIDVTGVSSTTIDWRAYTKIYAHPNGV